MSTQHKADRTGWDYSVGYGEGFLDGQIHTYCYMVSTGKPVASLQIKLAQLDEAIGPIIDYDLSYYVNNIDETWCVLFIYKQPFMREIIKESLSMPYSVTSEWFNGCMYGYSQEAIQNYILIPNKETVEAMEEALHMKTEMMKDDEINGANDHIGGGGNPFEGGLL